MSHPLCALCNAARARIWILETSNWCQPLYTRRMRSSYCRKLVRRSKFVPLSVVVLFSLCLAPGTSPVKEANKQQKQEQQQRSINAETIRGRLYTGRAACLTALIANRVAATAALATEQPVNPQRLPGGKLSTIAAS